MTKKIIFFLICCGLSGFEVAKASALLGDEKGLNARESIKNSSVKERLHLEQTYRRALLKKRLCRQHLSSSEETLSSAESQVPAPSKATMVLTRQEGEVTITFLNSSGNISISTTMSLLDESGFSLLRDLFADEDEQDILAFQAPYYHEFATPLLFAAALGNKEVMHELEHRHGKPFMEDLDLLLAYGQQAEFFSCSNLPLFADAAFPAVRYFRAVEQDVTRGVTSYLPSSEYFLSNLRFFYMMVQIAQRHQLTRILDLIVPAETDETSPARENVPSFYSYLFPKGFSLRQPTLVTTEFLAQAFKHAVTNKENHFASSQAALALIKTPGFAVDYTDYDDCTPLHYATLSGSPVVVKALIAIACARGLAMNEFLSVKTKMYRHTLFHYAVLSDDAETIKVLAHASHAYGLDMEKFFAARDTLSATPLITAFSPSGCATIFYASAFAAVVEVATIYGIDRKNLFETRYTDHADTLVHRAYGNPEAMTAVIAAARKVANLSLLEFLTAADAYEHSPLESAKNHIKMLLRYFVGDKFSGKCVDNVLNESDDYGLPPLQFAIIAAYRIRHQAVTQEKAKLANAAQLNN